MTVNLTIRQKEVIVVAADSGITNMGTRQEGGHTTQFTEYETAPDRKFRVIDDVCIITMWGQLSGHFSLLKHVSKLNITSSTHTVDDVADIAFKYLVEIYRPHELFQDEDGGHPVGSEFSDHTGYHVCGFTRDGSPKCYNIFWGTDIPPRISQQKPKYESYPKPYDEQPLKEGGIEFVYTGRHDLAGGIIGALFDEIKKGLDVRYDVRTTDGKIMLADMVMRFACEITPRIQPPFHLGVITPDNSIRVYTNHGLSPLTL